MTPDRSLGNRRARQRLTEQLTSHGAGFDFVQVVRLLTRLQSERAAIGGWADPSAEVLRLTVPPSLAFPPSEVSGITMPPEDRPDQPVRVGVRFLGLTGPQGVLPHTYTSFAANRTRARDTAFRDFLDLFHHRILSLFYRAWERHRPALAAERQEEDRVHSHLNDLAGLGTPGVQANAGDLAEALPFYAGLLGLQKRPAVGLTHLIGDYFQVPVAVVQFVGEWRAMEGGGQLCLGEDGFDGQLGFAVLGNAVYDPQARVRLRIGPLTRAQFDGFLPGGSAHEPLRALARLYADDTVGVDAQLVLQRADAPGVTLGTAGAPRLGFGSWLRNAPPTRDLDDVHMTLC